MRSLFSNQTIEIKFSELSNKLINGLKLYISLIKRNIYNGKNLKINSVDSSSQNREVAFCSELPIGILSFNSYLDIRSMNIIFSSVEKNEHKFLNIRSLYFMYACLKLVILDYLGFHKYSEQTGYNFNHLEISNIYHELEVYITTKNNAKQLKELKELELLKKQEINEIKGTTK